MTPLGKSLVVNGTLAALALGSLSLVLATESEPTTAEVESRRQHLLERFEEDLVDRLDLEHEGSLSIVRDDGDARFSIVAPVEAVAEEASVDQLLRELRFATWIRKLPAEEVDVGRMGFASPAAALKLTLGASVVELALGGDASSPKGARYVRVRDSRGENVYVVSATTAKVLTPNLADFRIQRLFPVGESDLSAMELTSPRGSIRMERRERWHLVGPSSSTRLDPTAMDRLFLQFARTQARDFLDVERARALQTNVDDVVTLKLFGAKPEQTSELVVGGKCPFDEGLTVALRKAPEPIAACVQSDLETAFLENTQLLLDRRLFALRIDEAEEVRIDAGERRLEFARKGEGYVMRTPKTGEVDKKAGDARLSALLEARGNLLLANDATPFEPLARASVMRAGAGGDERLTETVELGSMGTHPFVVRRLQDGALLEVDESVRASFAVDALLLRSPLLFDVEADDIREVTVRWRETSGSERVQRLRQPERGVFELDEPEGYEVDAGLALDLVDALHHLEAMEWVSETQEARFGLAEPSLTCTVSLKGEATARVLELGATAPGSGIYGSVDENGVFVLPRGTRDLLTTWVVDRSPFMLDTERLERVELSTRDRRLELTRLGTSFVQSNPGPVVSPPRILDLLDALSLLRAEGMVTPSAPEAAHGSNAPTLRVVATLRGDGTGSAAQGSAAQGSAAQGSVVLNRFTIGSADTFLDMPVFYAWPEDGQAVYALPRESVRRIMNLW